MCVSSSLQRPLFRIDSFPLLLPDLLTLHLIAETPHRTNRPDHIDSTIHSEREFEPIDAGIGQEYDEAHRIGVLNGHERNMNGSTSLLPKDKNSPLVISCNGLKCGKSTRGVIELQARGYLNSALYSERFPVCEERDLTMAARPEQEEEHETSKLHQSYIERYIRKGKGDFF